MLEINGQDFHRHIVPIQVRCGEDESWIWWGCVCDETQEEQVSQVDSPKDSSVNERNLSWVENMKWDEDYEI